MADVLDAPVGEIEQSENPLGGSGILARDVRFGLSSQPVRHWFGGDLFKTAVCDGLSIFLPTGERFFIRSLSHYLPKVADRALASRIREFSRQEAYHTREHEDYNRAMALLGYDVAEMERPVKEALIDNGSPVRRLAITCAVEHITASLSSTVLSRPAMWAEADARYRRLWIWHALEELEHKAVALEVFHAVTPGWRASQRYLFRTAAMTIVLSRFAAIFFRNARIYARRDGEESLFRFVLGMMGVLVFSPGFWRHSVLPVLSYYRPGFDPRTRDDRSLIRWACAELDRGQAPRPLATAG